jgi:prepilin-type N-terminal cleavage/methylation domain-containing protein
MSPPAGGNTCRRFAGKERGFNLFEFLIAVGVISVIAVLLLDRLLSYQAYAERTAMEVTVVNMRSGLRLRVAEFMTQDRMQEIGKLVNENPVRWLETPPPNYLGELADPLPKTLEQGNWYFDTTRRELVYLPRSNRYFMALWDDRKDAMRFQVTGVRQALGKDGKSESRIEWVTLSRTTP